MLLIYGTHTKKNFTSLGLSQLDGRTSGKLGRRALIYYVLTTTHAVLLGIIVVLLLHPGDPRIKGDGNTMDSTISGKITATDKFLDLFRNMLPENIVRSTFQQQQTVYVSLNITSGQNVERARLVYADGMNVLGLAIQCFGTLPLIYFIGTRQNPYPFLRGLGQAVLTALGTSSSAASLPVTFRCLNKLGIDKRVTKFVLPVGAMVNMVRNLCISDVKKNSFKWMR
ncbi:hypothetical protein ANCDUO_20329 [Ancylostoma duodenale]|uniref:Amino acid transporter n=1 Tax=Ancylostoma duodenale TaxID=51022 RepID=A0A0C2FXH1_9BILA|nr:hypothetical protein ANCDUO_20329 [Ancylostoma duodenale]